MKNYSKPANGLYPSGVKVWFIPQGKELWPGKVLTEGKENMDGKTKFTNIKWKHVTSCKNEDCNTWVSHLYFYMNNLYSY